MKIKWCAFRQILATEATLLCWDHAVSSYWWQCFPSSKREQCYKLMKFWEEAFAVFLKKSTVLNIIKKDRKKVSNYDEWSTGERILVKKKQYYLLVQCAWSLWPKSVAGFCGENNKGCPTESKWGEMNSSCMAILILFVFPNFWSLINNALLCRVYGRYFGPCRVIIVCLLGTCVHVNQ